MSDFRNHALGRDATIRQAIELTDRLPPELKIVLVLDGDGRLLGTITDGDIRRALLRGLNPDASVAEIMNTKPRTGSVGMSEAERETLIRREAISHLPLVDDAGRVAGLVSAINLPLTRRIDNPVTIMAGGFGRRLAPLTNAAPKPMIDVGGKPLLETIIRRCAHQGFHDFILSIHYKADVIRDHFGDGTAMGVSIRYVEEDEPRGTAGALGMLEAPPALPMVVTNGDILTEVDYRALIAHHCEAGAALTIAVREYEVQIPYGVIETDGARVLALREKPIEEYYVNAGIYVVDPSAFALLPRDGAYDMPDVVRMLQATDMPVAPYLIREYWRDIGRHDDLHQARFEFPGTSGA